MGGRDVTPGPRIGLEVQVRTRVLLRMDLWEGSVSRTGSEAGPGFFGNGAYPAPSRKDRLMSKQNVAKIIELVGSSDKSWSEAADTAVQTASRSIKNITGVEVVAMTAHVDDGKIVTFKSTVKVAFGVED